MPVRRSLSAREALARVAGAESGYKGPVGDGVSRRDFGLQLVQRSLAEFLADRCPQLAASIAYHVLFSIFPLAIVLAGASGVVLSATGSQGRAVDTIVGSVPLSGDGRDQLRHLLLGATGNLSALGLIGVVGLVYSASGMMAAIRTALNAAWDVEEVRPFLRGKLVDLGLVFLVALLSLGSLGATVALHVIGGGGWVVVSIAVPLVLGFAIVLFLYRVVPAAEVRLGDIWPAALFVAVAFTAAENLFALYVGPLRQLQRNLRLARSGDRLHVLRLPLLGAVPARGGGGERVAAGAHGIRAGRGGRPEGGAAEATGARGAPRTVGAAAAGGGGCGRFGSSRGGRGERARETDGRKRRRRSRPTGG